MEDKFREKAIEDANGLYVTSTQLQFFLNRPNGNVLYKSNSEEFLKYKLECELFNYAYDLTEEGAEGIIISWNDEIESLDIQLDASCANSFPNEKIL